MKSYPLQIYVFLFFSFMAFSAAGQDLSAKFQEHLHPSAVLHVITTLDPECPISQKYTRTLNGLQAKYSAENVMFYGIMSVQGIGPLEIKDFTSYYKLAFPCIPDSTLHLARTLKATVTPEVFLLDTDLNIIYSGAIDDWFFGLGQSKKKPTEFFLKEAIEDYLDHRPVTRQRTEPVGCTISYRLIKGH